MHSNTSHDLTLTYMRTYAYPHPMKTTATSLRSHLYEMLDQVARTGRPISIHRGGVELSIVRKDHAKERKGTGRVLPGLIVGDPDDLIHMEWPWAQDPDL